MRPLVLVAAVTVALTACGGGGDTSRLGPAAAPSTTKVAAPTATQPFNLDDMMGYYTQQTVFVGSTGEISAVTLLNHYIRYRIPTGADLVQVASDSPGEILYVLDAAKETGVRLRTIDVATGAERASRTETVLPASRRSLATAIDGRALVLRTDARHAWVDAYEYQTLKPQGVVMEKQGCGDRLLSSGTRVAIVCLATGEIAVDNLRGTKATVAGTVPNLVGTAMAGDGSIYVVTADQQLAVVVPNSTTLDALHWPSEWSGTVLADGIAAGTDAVAIAERTVDGAWLRVFAPNNLPQRLSMRMAGVPNSGIVALSAFAYYGVGNTIQHVNTQSGLLESMAAFGGDAVPLAVVNR
jgi:hypothetical protein